MKRVQGDDGKGVREQAVQASNEETGAAEEGCPSPDAPGHRSPGKEAKD